MLASSFWDFTKDEPVLRPDGTPREGRLILIGDEDNEALGIPENMIRRFIPGITNQTAFMEDLEGYLRDIVAAIKAGKMSLDVLGFDGWSETNFVYTMAYEEENDPENFFETWGAWKKKFKVLSSLMNPKVLNAHVLSTARVAEFKKGTYSKRTKETTGKDPDWMANFKYHPAMEGWARHNMAHYFNFVIYMEEDSETEIVKGKPVSRGLYRSHWLSTGDFRTKNIYAHKWKDDPVLDNATWPQIEAILDSLNTKENE